MERIIAMGPDCVVLREDGTWHNYQPAGPALTALQALEQPAALVQQFAGLFREAGIRLRDTGEQITCSFRGDRVAFSAGIDEAAVDFVVEAYAYQVARLVSQVASGAVDDRFWFRLARALLTQSALSPRHVLNNPLIANPVLRTIIGGKSLVHVYLVSPNPEEGADATMTLAYVNGRWLMIPGLIGAPQRIFRVTVDQALELQRHLFAGKVAAGPKEWLAVAQWYKGWRRRTEVMAP